MHLCHARHYSQEDMCIIGKGRKGGGFDVLVCRTLVKSYCPTKSRAYVLV